MAEKGILAYFNSVAEAQSCIPKLKALRAIDIQVDRIGTYPGGGISETFNPLSNNFPGLTYLTSAAAPMDRDAGILTAVNVDASGMADGSRELLTSDPDDMTRRDTLLTVVLDEASYEQALRVIREAGGRE
ncbi:hypothetical protein O9H85_01620 [Paenibacillus filicis]|uniref:Uncharacterized protein n=1 Tax=Paenibacillus gyeongsangnamensis TaxID=3388067 RepID=A0ABT4Q2U0_9BACL|nr:hypothetical protein [Paenibacillus filicis]MCZ8511156.1 hypothetical protein [Paenibacillus filicis]